MPWSTSPPTSPKPRAWKLTPPTIGTPQVRAWKVKRTRRAIDAGVGVDTATLDTIQIPATDTGLGADHAALPALHAAAAASGLGADRGLIVPELHVADAGHGADLARTGVRPADTGLGADFSQSRPRYAAIDRAVGADVLTISNFGAVANDTGLGRDAAAAGFGAHTPVSASYTAPGTYSYAIPVWCAYIELVGVGGGEGGDSGSGAFVAGAGGAGGVWNAITIQRGVDIPWTATSLTVVVGDGGTGGPAGPLNSDGAGGNPVVWSYSGTTLLTCSGGDDGGSGQNGKSPGNYTYNGVLYTGGAAQTSGSAGNPPGGGGRGGNGGFGVGLAGGKGAPGAGYARARQ